MLRCQQQFQRHVLQVCIVQHFFCQFSFQQCAAVLLHCADQRSHKRGGAAAVCLIVSCRAEQKVRFQGRYLFLARSRSILADIAAMLEAIPPGTRPALRQLSALSSASGTVSHAP